MEEIGSGAPFTEAALARLVLAAEAADLARQAHRLVPIDPRHLHPDGTAPMAVHGIDEAASLVWAAERILKAAVVTARLGGGTWPEIGRALAVTKQSAQERWQPAVTEFRNGLFAQEEATGGGHSPTEPRRHWLHPFAREPVRTALELDERVIAADAPGGKDSGLAPVSDGLAQMDPHAELRWLADLIDWSWGEPQPTAPALAYRLRLAERQLQLWRQIAAAEPRRTRATLQGMTHAEYTVLDLRAQHAAAWDHRAGAPMTAGRLKTTLATADPALPVRIEVADPLGIRLPGDTSYAVTSVGFGNANWGDGLGLRVDTSRLMIGGLPVWHPDALTAGQLMAVLARYDDAYRLEINVADTEDTEAPPDGPYALTSAVIEPADGAEQVEQVALEAEPTVVRWDERLPR